MRNKTRTHNDLNLILDKFSQEITLKDLNRIAANKKQTGSAAVTKKYFGQLVHNASATPAYWYVNPGDNLRYGVEDFVSFYQLMKVIGFRVTDQTLRQSAMNSEQLTYDPTFIGTAYVCYDGKNYDGGYRNKQILPLASMTKLMTALVFYDQNPDWDREIIITPEEINYPKTLVGNDATSEVNLKAGDKVKINNLWIAMLTASSNQAAVILADNSGLSREEFVAAMNKKAIDLGLTKTHFEEMAGLDPNNVSTPEEFAVIASTAFKNSKIAASTQVSNYTFGVMQADWSVRAVNVANRNYSLLAMGADASKTGYLVEAQRNVVLQKDGKIVVVMHAASTNERNLIIKQLLGEGEVSLAR